MTQSPLFISNNVPLPNYTGTNHQSLYSSQDPVQDEYPQCCSSELDQSSEPDRFFNNFSTQFQYDSDSTKNHFEFKDSCEYSSNPSPNTKTSHTQPEPYIYIPEETFKISSSSCGNSTESLTGTSSILRMGSGKHTALPGSRVRFSRVYSVQSESNLGRIKETGNTRMRTLDGL